MYKLSKHLRVLMLTSDFLVLIRPRDAFVNDAVRLSPADKGSALE